MSGNSTNYFAHQDIETLVLRGKNIHAKKKAQREGNTETRDKYDSSHSNAMRKLENETENFKVQKLNPKISKAIVQGRMAKGWNRKTLANNSRGLSEALVGDYETGKAKYKIQEIQKLERALGIKLTGKEFK